jgi:hypothetical protein
MRRFKIWVARIGERGVAMAHIENRWRSIKLERSSGEDPITVGSGK